MDILQTPSPNFNSRDGQAVDMLVLHYTDMQSGAAALERLCEASAEVSAHYLVDEDGSVHQLVDEEMRAWHAGKSYWRGHSNINQRSIGIEIANPGHRFGYRPFPEAQMQSVTLLCQDILTRHAIPARNVVGHSDITPTRKKDPGELFDWRRLAEKGVGLFQMSGVRNQVSEEILSDTRHPTPDIMLQQYGYDTTDLKSTITAFQRHFRQNLLSGQWDRECEMALQSLLKMIGKNAN